MAMDRTEVIGKILERAEHPGTPAPEAQALLARAADLMYRWDIKEAEARARIGGNGNGKNGSATKDDVIVKSIRIDGKGGHAMAKLAAMSYIVNAMGGEAAYLEVPVAGRKGYGDKMLIIVAHESTIANFKAILPAAAMAWERGAVQARKAAVASGVRGHHAYRSYIQGFGMGLGSRIEAGNSKLKDEVKGTGTELVIRTREDEVKSAFAEKMGEVRERKSAVGRDTNAFITGMLDGKAFGSSAVSSGEPSELEG